ncbi:hypothetical protein LTR56_026457 [Elasticomyces elasticus]|nr:hypothetical protein LTR22_027963 [Elasticomyces elasticus]KAK3615651.1 hypothetical protein LTR56_026457 [Elasticomyces elasticus]
MCKHISRGGHQNIFGLHHKPSSKAQALTLSVALQPRVDVPSLLTLPAEIRNLIYKFIFQGTHAPAHPRGATPAVLRVCRQLKAEANGIFYTNSSFDFRDFHVGVAWLVRLDPERRKVITEVRYDCSDEMCEQPMWWARMGGEGCVGLKEEARLDALRATLASRGIVMMTGVLKVGVRIRGVLVWTSRPVDEVSRSVHSNDNAA